MERTGEERTNGSIGIERVVRRRVSLQQVVSMSCVAKRLSIAKQFFRACVFLLLSALATTASLAGVVNYEYDALGRLKEVRHADGSVVSYTLDAAGNREEVASRTPPGVPSSITVPSSSTTGSYTISWGAASGMLTVYELYEANNSGFSGQTLVYSGAALSEAISGKGNGAYYYRVRACNGSVCGAYRAGSNAATVTLPPSVPASISVPSSSTTGSYTVSWGVSTGNVTAYQLYEATNSSFSGQVQVYSGTGTSRAISGNGNGAYYYRVRACDGSVCSGYRTGSNPVSVTLPPGVPSSISVPSSSTTGDYTVSWGASTGNVTAYQLYEATNSSFSGQVQVYSGTGTSGAISGKSNGSYYYRVRACNGSACSSYRTGSNTTTVTLPPSVPASISAPSGSITGSYTVSWGASTGNVTAYKLYEATNSSFSGQVQVYSGTGTSRAISGKSNGAYYYRVRACNGSACSGYRTDSNPVSVTHPPGVPGAAVVPTYSKTGSYTVSWGTSTGNVTAYELLQSAFGSETLIYNGTATSVSRSGMADGVYSYRLRACNTSAACSAYTASQGNGDAVMVDKTAPTPPTSLNRTGQTNLYWSGGSTDSGGSGVDEWRVYRSGSHVGTTAPPTQAFNDSAAPSNATYSYTVRSVDRAGNVSGPSPTLTVYVDTIAPNAPTGVTAVAVNSQTVNLSWTAATDPNGGTVAGYHVYRGGSPIDITTATSYSNTGLAASTTYSYTVRAYDSVGHMSGHSNSASATTWPPVVATLSTDTWRWVKRGTNAPRIDPPVVCTGSGGTGSGYTYTWQRVSGDTQTSAVSPASSSTRWSRDMPYQNATYTSTWRCLVTDSGGGTAENTVTVTFTMNTLQ